MATIAEAQAPVPSAVAVVAGDVPVGGGAVVVGLVVEEPAVGLVAVDVPGWGGPDGEGTDGEGPVEHATTSRVAAVATAIMAPDRRPGNRVVGVSGTRRRYLLDLWRYVDRVPPTARPVVLDVDTGVDDACALLLAATHPALDLRAVTCVGGNAAVDAVVRNTLTVLEAAARSDVPVARGADRPLLEHPTDARHVHGEDGMGDLGWPAPSLRPDSRHAVELLRDTCVAAAEAGEQVTLVPTAPLTNIALLLRTYPAAARGIAEIVFMGGAAQSGNATASAEFNVFHDPEAAAIALDAAAELAIPVTMYGLDVFYDPVVTGADAAELVAVGGRGAAELGGRLIQFQCERFGRDAATIGDAGAVCAVLDPGGLTTQVLPLRVELAGHWSRGRTIIDRRDWSGDLSHDPHGEPPVRVRVALGVDHERYSALWRHTILATAGPR